MPASTVDKAFLFDAESLEFFETEEPAKIYLVAIGSILK